MATIRDVAKRANVGVGTVSRVLNNSEAVRPVTREKVLKAIEELNYTPNISARRLSTGITKAIAVIIPSLTLESTFERLKGIQISIDQTEYDLILYSPNAIEKRKEILMQVANGGLTDGVILMSFSPTEEEMAILSRSKTPFVSIEAKIPNISSVHIDNRKGGYLATQHLIEMGHHNIGIMTYELGEGNGFSPMRSRYDGYRDALAQAQIEFRSENHRVSPHMLHDAERIAKEWLSSQNRPTAIFTSSDIQAIGILKAAKEFGINVPNELSVVGFDDIETAHLMELTTIEQPLYESGVEAVQILMQLINQEVNGVIEKELPVNLLKRNTTNKL